jgi:hypothetical protein
MEIGRLVSTTGSGTRTKTEPLRGANVRCFAQALPGLILKHFLPATTVDKRERIRDAPARYFFHG